MYRVSLPQKKNLEWREKERKRERKKLLLCLPCIKFGLDLKINEINLLSLVEHMNFFYLIEEQFISDDFESNQCQSFSDGYCFLMSFKHSSGLCKSWGVIASFCWNDCMRVSYIRSFVNLLMNVRHIYLEKNNSPNAGWIAGSA